MSETPTVHGTARRALIARIMDCSVDRRTLVHLVVDAHGLEAFSDTALLAMIRLIDAIQYQPTENESC